MDLIGILVSGIYFVMGALYLVFGAYGLLIAFFVP